MQSVKLSTYVICKDLDERGVRAISGALCRGLFLDQPIPLEAHADIAYEEEVVLNQVPSKGVTKMARREHVDAFFKNGELFLGNFEFYNRFDHEEIGDASEGAFLLVGHLPPTTAFVEIAEGFSYHVFCCYSGEPDESCIARFGYDSGFRIIDVIGFADAVGKALGCSDQLFGHCIYRRDKVVVGTPPENFRFDQFSGALTKLVSKAKFFVKPDRFAHQCEFRFLWSSQFDLKQPKTVKCPEAVKFCERI